MPIETQEAPAALKDESQLVTFLLKDEEFGFDIMSVQEIIRLPAMAKVPRTPAYVDGIANLRGVVLPVIDMRTRFGMERAPDTDRTRVLVVDINGVKTGLRVDRVKQVTRVMRSEIEAPPPAIQGSTTSDYLEGLVKLENGQRMVLALNAQRVCEIGIPARSDSGKPAEIEARHSDSERRGGESDGDVQKLVTFRIAKEEFAFRMEHVREILRVTTPNQVPDVPEYVLGILTVRGEILPVLDLRTLLQQRSLADEFAGNCCPLREGFERWLEEAEKAFEGGLKLNGAAPEHLRTWLSETNSSSQLLMEHLAKARGLNEKVLKQLQARAKYMERGDDEEVKYCGDDIRSAGTEVIASLKRFEEQIGANIQEDQRIIVVDAGGVILGLVVDHVHEVLNVSKSLLEPPPQLETSGGMELAGVAKLNDGSRLILLLDVAHLIRDEKLRKVQQGRVTPTEATETVGKAVNEMNVSAAAEQSELQLVTFMLGDEEFGIPISQIQEIDRLSKITKVPKAAVFIEGITNLRGEVIPVLDTRKRFDMQIKDADDRTRIIIVDLGGLKTGLVVDSVRQVLSLSRKDIAAPPEAIGSGVDQQFISGIGKVDGGKRMIVLLDVERILSRQEKADLSELAA